MATTTTATTTTPATVTTAVTTSWLKLHEKMVICVLVLATAVFLGGKYLDSSAAKAQANATVAVQLAADAKLSAQQAATQAAQVQAQYQAMVDILQKQNAALAQAVTQRDAVLGQQQTVDKTLSPTQLTQRWAQLVPNTLPIATPTGVTVTTTDAQATVAELENVPVLTQNLKDQTAIAANLQSELDGANKAGAENNTVITALNAEITNNDKACKAEVASVKAAGKKNSLKWFKRGFIAGFLSGLFTAHAAGI